jgi:hypothetical protein
MTQIMKRAMPVVAAATVAASATALPFTIIITNLGPQPLAPVFYATSTSSFDIFDAGAAASPAMRLMAEEGDTSMLVAQAAAAGPDVMSFGSTTGPFFPGESRTFIVEASMTHRWLQFASMLGMTNDAFIGSAVGYGDDQIDLFQGGQPLTGSFTLSFLNVWDAGTEVNTELLAHIPPNVGAGIAENGFIHRPHEGITGRGDIPTAFNWYGQDVALITIAPVPEPATMAVLGLGALALARRRRNR